MPETIKQLKDYFSKHDDVLMAFVFGSRAAHRERAASDWDIGVYFKTDNWLELESTSEYPGENKIHADLERILGTEVDMLTLNRARPSLVFTVLNSGLPLSIKDQRLYLELLSRSHYEAVDYWNFVREFWEIRQKAASLTPEAKALMVEHLTFLENEFSDLTEFQGMTWKEYREDRSKRRSIERWIENLVMSAMDIAKIVLASEKKDVPQTYREALREFGLAYFNEAFASRFCEFAELRNIVAHEYLDMRWAKIKNFIENAAELYPVFIKGVKNLLEDRKA